MNAGVPRYAPPIKIFQKKKKKKRKPFVQVEGFKKASFSEKILPDTWLKSEASNRKLKCVLKLFGWRFFLKPEGLELAFLNTWNLSLLPFFIYFFLKFSILFYLFFNRKLRIAILLKSEFYFYLAISNQMSLFNRILSEVLKVDLKDRRLWKGYQILWMDE